MPITILDFVQARVGYKDSYPAADFTSNGVEMIGGCERCAATIGAYNAYPSTSGNWRCANSIGTTGYVTVEDFTTAHAQASTQTHTGHETGDTADFPDWVNEPDGPWINCPSCGCYDHVREIDDRIFECSECEVQYTL